MNDPDKLLQRIAAATRREGDPSADALPFGLATRVLARLDGSLPENPWERLALGALPVGAAAALLCFLVPEPASQETSVSEDYQVAQAFIQTAVEP
jgi:hypothetical protein